MMFTPWHEEIEQIKQIKKELKTTSITEALITYLTNDIIKNEEKMLIKMFFDPNVNQNQLDELLKKWDIEVKTSDKNLLLSYFMKYHTELEFNSYTKPRLVGLLNNIRFKNIKLFSHFIKIGKLLNANNITPILLKGGAMRILRPELPRIMGDIDILVDEKDLFKCVSLATEIGYTYEIELHSVDLHDKDGMGALDIHKFIYFGGKNDKKILSGLVKRATKQNVYGINVLIPCNEDLLFIVLNNLAKNLRYNTSRGGLLFSIFDSHYLINSKKKFDWNIVIKNARLSKTHGAINFAMNFINNLTPYVLKGCMNTKFDKETENYSLCLVYKRFCLLKLREITLKMRQKKALKDFTLIDHVKTMPNTPKYLLLKQFDNHPFFIKTFIKDMGF